jgi:uncharacterized protein
MRMSRTVLTWVVVLTVAIIALAVLVRVLEPRLAFYPVAGETATPDSLAGAYTAGFIDTADGQRLRVWSLPHPAPRAIVLYFHGNGGNLSIWAPVLAGIRGRGYSVHALDYRGYGLSSGRPSERGLFRDVDAFLAWATQRPPGGVPIVYWGRSLGTTMAAYAGSVQAADGIILESGFPDMRTLLRGSPLAVVAPLSAYRFATASLLERVTQPVFVMHGDADRVVPYAAGRALFDRLRGPKEFFAIRGADHNDLTPPDTEAYWSAVASFVAALRPRRQ